MKRRNLTTISIVIGLFLLLGPYQNCALHQSEGRQQFEKLVLESQRNSDSGCLPFLATNQAGPIMNDTLHTTTRLQNSFGYVCLISAETPALNDELSGLETVVCTLEEEASLLSVNPATQTLPQLESALGDIAGDQIFYFDSDLGLVQPPQPAGVTHTPPTGEAGFFGYSLASAGADTDFIFMNTNRGLKCSMQIDTAVYQTSEGRTEAVRRAALLSHAIDQNLESN